MPTYIYQREDGSTFEIVQKITEDALKICPETGSQVKRVITPPAIVFKGSGFYKTDYCGNGASASDSGVAAGDTSKETSSAEKGTADKSTTSAVDSACNGKGPTGGCGACS
jgi:putative FmdB family regulatory protein